jgi:hypothetical protein
VGGWFDVEEIRRFVCQKETFIKAISIVRSLGQSDTYIGWTCYRSQSQQILEPESNSDFSQGQISDTLSQPRVTLRHRRQSEWGINLCLKLV